MALLGMGTALVINGLLARWNPHHTPGRASLIGLTASLGVVALCQLALHLALEAGLGRSLFSLGAATYLFWFGLPGLIQVCAGAVGAWQLNRHRSGGRTEPGLHHARRSEPDPSALRRDSVAQPAPAGRGRDAGNSIMAYTEPQPPGWTRETARSA
jgi:hypothetical protein